MSPGYGQLRRFLSPLRTTPDLRHRLHAETIPRCKHYVLIEEVRARSPGATKGLLATVGRVTHSWGSSNAHARLVLWLMLPLEARHFVLQPRDLILPPSFHSLDFRREILQSRTAGLRAGIERANVRPLNTAI